MKRRTLGCGLVVMMLAAATTARAQSYSVGGKLYIPAGPTESVTANFKPADGGVSVGGYVGLVRLVVSGSGVSCTPATNDAFYIHEWLPGCSSPNVVPQHDSSWYQLTFDTQTLVGGNPSRDATRFIVFDIDAGVEVLSRPYVPAYRAGHTYTFIVDTGSMSAAQLHFGVSDGGFGDNSGAYQIQITQLALRPPVPFDVNGDRTSDIMWRHATGGDLWSWGMAHGAKALEAYVGAVVDPNWEIKGQGDLNGDGKADLLWRHKTSGTIYYWQMDGATPAAELYVSTVDTSYDVVGTADFDGDGKADILWRNPTLGDLWVWRMNGAAIAGEAYVDTVAPSYVVKGLGDLNGDVKADVVWQGPAGDVWVWQMDGAVKAAQSYVGTVGDLTYQIQQVADFGSDGKGDLLWWNTVAGDVWIWTMDGTAVTRQDYVGIVPDTNYRVQAAGDYDGDGKADVLWRHLGAGDLWVWLMDGPVKVSAHYLGTVQDAGYGIVK